MAGNRVCSHCESVIPADSLVCPNCGAEFEPVEIELNQFNPVSSAPQQPPSALQYTQDPDQSVSVTPNAKPRKSKKIIYIIIAVIAFILLCLFLMGVIVILALRSTGLNH